MKRFIITFILIITTMVMVSYSQNKMLTIEDIWSSSALKSNELGEVRSMNDGKHYSDLVSSGGLKYIVVKSYSTGNTTDTLFSSAQMNSTGSIENYEFNNDESKILIATDVEKIYRHSSRAFFLVYDIASKKLTPVSSGGRQQNATFNPKNDKIAFVRDNNIFISDPATGTEKQITSDGKINEIINGIPDWVYEEEFSFYKGFEWSANGKYLAYYRFNEGKVREFNLTYYNGLYPEERKYKYPKAGEANSQVEIFIYNEAEGKSVKAEVNKEADQYIPRIKWIDSTDKLCVMRMNRLQNKIELYSCNSDNGSSELFFMEENKAYLEITDDFTFTKNGSGFIWTSTADGFNHIYQYDLKGKLVRQLTKGNWDVTAFYGYDTRTGNCYFQAAMKNPMSKGVYKCSPKGKISVVSETPGTNTAVYSRTYDFYFITNSGINSPHKITLYNSKGKSVRTIEDNAAAIENMNRYSLSNAEFFKFTTSEGVELNGWMIKPAGFDAGKKYPVLQYMYGGPGSQTVRDQWLGPNYLWFQLLAQKGYIIVSVDNRGTGARGESFNKCIYKQLGHLETIDQIEVAKYLGTQSYVDKSRIGAWGWSYGGYMTSLLMTKGADYFKAAVAVAPVTTWRFYDTIYTERYLQTPQLNPDGYDLNSPINFADKLNGKFLLIHGTTDDNVHMQNSMEFTDALIKNKKQFDLFLYPGKAHGISGVRTHLYIKMTDFFISNL